MGSQRSGEWRLHGLQGPKKKNASSHPLSEFNVFKSRLSNGSPETYSISGHATSSSVCRAQAWTPREGREDREEREGRGGREGVGSTPREVRGVCSSLSLEYASTITYRMCSHIECVLIQGVCSALSLEYASTLSSSGAIKERGMIFCLCAV